MALVKAQQFRPAMPDAVALDLGDVARQAARLRVAAEGQAARIVEAAQREAQRLVEDAKGQGFEQGKAEGRAEGHEAGLAAGKAEALAEWTPQLTSLAQSLEAVVGELDARRLEIEQDARGSVLRFALTMGEKVVQRRVEVEPEAVIDQVERALSMVLGATEATVCLHPEDVAVMQEAQPALGERLRQAKQVRWSADESLGRGGCVVEAGDGLVDASIETQLRRIVAALLPGEAPGEGPADNTPPAEPPASG